MSAWVARIVVIVAVLVSLSALSFRSTQTEQHGLLILPIVANGEVGDAPHFQSTFTFLNPSQDVAESVFSVYDDAGTLSTGRIGCTPVAPPPERIDLTIPSQGTAHYTGITDIPLFNGWASLQWTGSVDMGGSVEIAAIDDQTRPCLVICNRPSTRLVSTTLLEAVRPAIHFQASSIITPQRHSAFAVVNPSPSETATATVALLTASGDTLQVEGRDATFTYEIAPRHRVADFVWALLFDPPIDDPLFDPPPAPPLPEQFHGSLLVTSDRPVAVGGLHVLLPEGKLVAIPVVASAGSGSGPQPNL